MRFCNFALFLCFSFHILSDELTLKMLFFAPILYNAWFHHVRVRNWFLYSAVKLLWMLLANFVNTMLFVSYRFVLFVVCFIAFVVIDSRVSFSANVCHIIAFLALHSLRPFEYVLLMPWTAISVCICNFQSCVASIWHAHTELCVGPQD